MQLFQPQLGDSWNAGESYSFPYRSKGPAHCPGTKEGHACCARRLECKSGQGCLWKLAFSPLLLSALSSSHFHCALQKFFCLFWARPDEQRDVHTTSLCVFFLIFFFTMVRKVLPRIPPEATTHYLSAAGNSALPVHSTAFSPNFCPQVKRLVR